MDSMILIFTFYEMRRECIIETLPTPMVSNRSQLPTVEAKRNHMLLWQAVSLEAK